HSLHDALPISERSYGAYLPLDPAGEGGEARRVGVRLGLERIGDKRIGGEQVERQLAPARGVRRHAAQQPAADGREVARQRLGPVRYARRKVPRQRRRRRRMPRLEPRQHRVSFHRSSRLRTTSATRDSISGSLATSPTPAEAKCGRPPPLPPTSAARSPASSPALSPRDTRSSVTAMWRPGRPPLVS